MISIYQKKQTWKIFLVVFAMIIVAGSLFYTNHLVQKIAREEKLKVKLWAEAIQKKAKLLEYTQELFTKLEVEERKKVELFAKAWQKISKSDMNDSELLSFMVDLIKSNETVPVILLNDNSQIISSKNLDTSETKTPEILNKQMDIFKRAYPPIVIPISEGKKNYLYYKDSKILIELKSTMNDIIKSFISEIVTNSASVPVILTDTSQTKVLYSGNVDSSIIKNPNLLKEKINEMQLKNTPIAVEINEGKTNYVFYEESALLKQLKYYPYIQFGIIGLFLLIAYTLFSTARKSEQNQVWVGMSKETAHQLGTPLSSLMAWLELLKEKNVDKEITDEISKDLERLQTITERFSKIGSAPQFVNENISEVLNHSINYLKTRVSSKVKFSLHSHSPDILYVPLCIPLFEWVIENIVKNAVDAMNGSGNLNIEISREVAGIIVDISDTGKGIDKTDFKNVFKPGFTTKKRGWGLGLSLTKRIIEDYHKGKIFVKQSEQGKGTTFRIIFKSAE